MRIISDIEIHSRFSRACSPELTIPNIAKWADIKGVNLVGTGDFTHPVWFKEMKESLEPADPGFFRLKNSDSKVQFILSSEISCIFSQDGRVRRVHLLVYAPTFEAVEKFTKTLADKGAKLASDGRPILGMTAKEVLGYLLEADDRNVMIPAHVWTPYFGIFGSKSGFDTLEEAFGDLAGEIFAIETGLSSDPKMNRRISSHDRLTLVSSSDAHSLPRIGREANVMEIEEKIFSYDEFMRVIREKDQDKFKYTIEYFPEEGRYHMDGHAACKFCCLPNETKKYKGRCPECGRKITVGVLSRIDELADRPADFEARDIPGKHLVPLEEILSECTGVGVKTKTVQNLYQQLIERGGNEFNVILDMPISDLKSTAGPVIAEAIHRVREEKVNPIPGYDGEYGVIKIFTDEERNEFLKKGKQKELF